MTVQKFFERLSYGIWQVTFTDTPGVTDPVDVISVHLDSILTIVLDDTDLFLDDDLIYDGTQQIYEVNPCHFEVSYRLSRDVPAETLIFIQI